MSDSLRSTGNIARDTGGFDLETNELFDASFECFDCGLYYSWPVTPGLAPVKDPKQTEMLALVAAHTPAACRAAQARNAVEREKEDAAEKAYAYAERENHVTRLDLLGGWRVDELEKAEADGIPCPVGGDCKVSLMDAIKRGAVTVARGLPAAVERLRRSQPADDAPWPQRWMAGVEGVWPSPSHETVTASMVAMRATQRRLFIGGWLLPCRGDNTDAVEP